MTARRETIVVVSMIGGGVVIVAVWVVVVVVDSIELVDVKDGDTELKIEAYPTA